MIKKIALFTAVTLTVSALSACGKGTVDSTNVKESNETVSSITKETEVVEEITYPEELTIFSSQGAKSVAAGFTSSNDAYWAQELERITGTHVEWIHHKSDVIDEKFNLMIASEEYTDAIVYNWPKVEGGPELYLEDEVIIDLTELIPECMPNFNAYLEEHPEVKRIIANDDGKILYIPFIREDVALNIYVGPQIRTDWLEKLGLNVPKTTEDLYNVLKAFKTQDPNGNGEADEIPMSGSEFRRNEYGVGNLLWAFDTHYSFYVEDGKVVWGPAEEKFAEGIEYIAMLYKEGLLDVDYLLNDRAAMDSKAIADRVGFEFSFQPTKYQNDATFNDGTRRMAGIQYLTTPDNDSKMCFNPAYTESVVTKVALAVTTACENPKGLLKWLDTVFSEEGIIFMNYGKEGTHFEYVDGKPQLIDFSSLTTEEQTLVQANTMMIDTVFPSLQQWGAYSATTSQWGGEAIATWADGVDTSGILPQIALTTEEKEQIADTLTQLEAYADTQINNVIIGELNMDKWPDVVKKFHDMGIDKILEIYNAAYQRYMSK